MKLTQQKLQQIIKEEILKEVGLAWSEPNVVTKVAKGRQQMGKMTANDLSMIRQIVSIADPTGVLSYPDVKSAYQDMMKDKTVWAVGGFLLALTAAIPLIGKLAAPFKAAKLAKVAAAAQKGAKILDKTADGAKMAQKIRKQATAGRHREAVRSANKAKADRAHAIAKKKEAAYYAKRKSQGLDPYDPLPSSKPAGWVPLDTSHEVGKMRPPGRIAFEEDQKKEKPNK